MKPIQYASLFFIASIAAAFAQTGEITTDPVAHLRGFYDMTGVDKIYRLDSGIRPNSLVVFNKSQYRVGLITEIGQSGLLHLECGRGGQAKCQLEAVIIDGDGFKEIPIGPAVNAETDYEKLSHQFPQTPTPAVEELTP